MIDEGVFIHSSVLYVVFAIVTWLDGVAEDFLVLLSPQRVVVKVGTQDTRERQSAASITRVSQDDTWRWL